MTRHTYAGEYAADRGPDPRYDADVYEYGALPDGVSPADVPHAYGADWAQGEWGSSNAALGEPRAEPRRFIAFVAFVWGMMLVFSGALSDQPFWMMTGAIALVALLLSLYTGGAGPLLTLFRHGEGLLVALSVFGAVMSMLMNHLSLVTARYVLFAVTFSLVLAIRNDGPASLAAARRGFTWAGVLFALYHLPLITSAGLTNPLWRLTNSFLNPNSSSFIAAMTAISLTDYIVERFRSRRRGWWGLSMLLAALGTCFVLMVATKSRSAALTYLAGALVYLGLRTRWWVTLAFLILALPLWVVTSSVLSRFGQEVVRVYSLDDTRHRKLNTLTGRTENWQFALEDQFYPNPAFGGGPGSSVHLRAGIIHNGLLIILCETGLIGTLPLIALLTWAQVNAIRLRKRPEFHFAIAIFAAAIVQSLGNPVLFSIGNSGSMLFFLGLVTLVRPQALAGPGPAPAPAAAPDHPMAYGEGYADASQGPAGNPGEEWRWT